MIMRALPSPCLSFISDAPESFGSRTSGGTRILGADGGQQSFILEGMNYTV